MSRSLRLPRHRFADWEEYANAHKVDVIPDLAVMRCRACRTEWQVNHNRGKLLQRAHVCPNGCNGKPKTSLGGRPFGSSRADERTEQERREAGRQRRLRTKAWWTVRTQVDPARFAQLDRLWEEAADQPDPLAYVIAETQRLRAVDRA